DFNLQYEAEKTNGIRFLASFRYFRTKKVEAVYNRLFNPENTFKLFDIHFSEGEFIAKGDVRTTMLHIKLNSPIPKFTLDREGFLEKASIFAGFRDIPIKNHSDFTNRFYLRGENEAAIRAFFTDTLVLFFESNPYYHIESNGEALLLYSKERIAGVKEIKLLHDFGKRLLGRINPPIAPQSGRA
ncbi:MAG: SulP family inorganic anion transporter, partial [Marinirhabdus sp.]